jgi:hypothetical protein
VETRIDELGERIYRPRTLAVMHGSSYTGPAAALLETLGGFYDELLQARCATQP